MGRRKIEIKKIENKAYLKATFSKRRKGLFAKAKELCKLCGAVIAILTISPGGRFYNFGHPDVDSIVSRYCKDEGMVREFVNEDDSDTMVGDDHELSSASHEEDEDDEEFVYEDDEDYFSESEEVKDEEEEEEVDEDVLPIDMVTSDNAGDEEEEEKEPAAVEEIKEMNLIDKID